MNDDKEYDSFDDLNEVLYNKFRCKLVSDINVLPIPFLLPTHHIVYYGDGFVVDYTINNNVSSIQYIEAIKNIIKASDFISGIEYIDGRSIEYFIEYSIIQLIDREDKLYLANKYKEMKKQEMILKLSGLKDTK